MLQNTEATGVFQSDLCIRHALLQGFRELRASTWLLDYICNGLKFDELTAGTYGQREVLALKNWFLKTEIPVVVYGRLGSLEAPAVTINLVSSTEKQNTLGDIHYTPEEDVVDDWPNLAGPFDATLVVDTGVVTVPVAVTIDIFPGMVIIDAQGVPHEILDVSDDRVFTVAPNQSLDLRGAFIRGGSPAKLQTLESAAFEENYLIGCHVNGEPLQLVFLHSIVTFVLLWGRETLLEGRGFEVSTFGSTDFAKNQALEAENMWSRYVNITGTVRHTWPKRRHDKITGVLQGLRVHGAANLPPEMRPPSSQLWIGETDDLDSVG